MLVKKISTILMVAALSAAPAFAANDTLVTVNGVAIPKYRADVLISEQKVIGIEESEEMRDEVREMLIRNELVAAEARRAGLDKKPEVRGLTENAQARVLARAYLEGYIESNPASEEEIKAIYEQLKERIGNTEYKIRHILLENEKKAKEIIAKLQKGEKFATLAKESKDAASKDKGGSLDDWMSPAAFVPPFAEALTKLGKGQFSKQPVQTQFGYHVILVEDTRPTKLQPLDDLRPQIVQRLNQQKVDKLVEDLRGKAEIK
ncbi:MAG: peptidylprolyl isomerase [Zoogloeaceae bacterium]|jgi:peptidyl-prolyl cis-trans isomerase C|nr:peptidylprolyl isomerase [Zoogloeaceae bacterium]